MGSLTWDKMGREPGSVSSTVAVCLFKKAFPKLSDTWAGPRCLALEPEAFWHREPHQDALPSQPCSHQIREGGNGTDLLLLRNNRRVPNISEISSRRREAKEKSFKQDDELWEG